MIFLLVLVACTIFQVSTVTDTECPVDKPEWPNKNVNRNLIIDWLLDTLSDCKNSEVEYPSYDGWYHNLAKMDLGSVEQPLFRGWSAIRAEASQKQNWSMAWNEIVSGTPVCKSTGNALLLFFSKQVANEILNTEIPSCVISDYLDTSIPYTTKQYNNYATPYIDGGIIYGKSSLSLKTISFEDGSVDINRVSDLEVYDELNIISIFRIIWLRWHNHLATRIHNICPKWSFEKVFNEARKWTIAVQQSIFAYEWLPLWTGKQLDKYSRYDPTVDPQVSKLFQATMGIPQSVSDIKDPFFPDPLESNSFWDNYNVEIDELLKKLTQVSCENISTLQEVEYVQQKHDLPDINHARKVFKLNRYMNWTDFTTKNNLNDSMLFAALAEQKLHRLDAMIGGTLESRGGNGELFSTVIYDQFRRIRDGDRFWFENVPNNLFSCEEVVKIGEITFSDVILTVTNVDLEQKGNISVFTASKSKNMSMFLNNTRGTIPFGKSSHTLFFPGVNFYIAPFLLMSLIFSEKLLTRPRAKMLFLGTCGIALCLILRKQVNVRNLVEKEYSDTKQALQDDWQMRYPLFPVKEHVGVKKGARRVVIILKKDRRQITVQSFSGTVLRVIDFNSTAKTVVKVINLCDEPTLIIQFTHNYDLVLKFESNYLRTAFTTELNAFIASNTNLEKELITNFNWKSVRSVIVTKEHRQTWLEMFFRVAFAQAFKIQHSRYEMLKVDAFIAKEVIYTELTIVEFAEALSLHVDNEFVKRMFMLVDKDRNGFISFREFVDLLIIFAEGSQERKVKLMFDLYDINGTGLIPARDFSAMIKSFLETVGGKVYEVNIEQTIIAMLRSAGVEHKTHLDFEDFKKIIGDDIDNLSKAKLGFRIQKQDETEAMYKRSDDLGIRFKSFTKAVDQKQAEIIRPPVQQSRVYSALLFFELHSKELFWVIFITLLVVFAFIQKIYDVNRKNNLLGINWYIFGVTRGAKYAMLLTYAALFITMCKSIWTKLRDLFANRYFPFDYLIQIHVYVAYLSAIFTAIHVIGETLIFYKIAFTSNDSACLLNKHLMNQERSDIHLMFWLDYVVITGFILTILLFIVYLFAQTYIRLKLCNMFHFTHNLYPVIIFIIIIHGSQSPTPLIYSVVLGPLIVFLVDLFVRLKIKKMELPVIRVEFFPSSVICLVLRRPENFQYKVGQWVRLSVPEISRREFHSVSLSVAPHEPNLRIYIRPSSSWACQVYSLFEGPGSGYAAAPVRVLLDGPYGGGAQHWRLYDVVVLVAGGCGVAPFAAILKDVIYALKVNTYLHCQKVYFIWVAKTQKHFEWMVDLVQETEESDQKHYLSCHMFITQFYEKFDLRTIMLYICEKHYQRISGKSLFTNLRAVTHFGRPVFPEFFETVQSLHPSAKHVGIFSSGPTSLCQSVNAACLHINSQSDQRFEHHSNKF